MKKISTSQAPAAIGPYSQAVCLGRAVFTSGQIPVVPETGVVPEGIEAQAHQSCKNVAAILAAAGTSMEKVVKTTCYLADMADFAVFNAVYETYFTQKPARACVAVRSLPKGVLCEVEAIAELDKYLDDAYIAHLKSVRIVHGKGTGALRKGVHNYLKRQKHVDSFRLGEFGEGDAGVTIVEFKK